MEQNSSGSSDRSSESAAVGGGGFRNRRANNRNLALWVPAMCIFHNTAHICRFQMRIPRTFLLLLPSLTLRSAFLAQAESALLATTVCQVK